MKILGSGCITPLGNNEHDIWNGLFQNHSPKLDCKLKLENLISPKVKRRMSRFSVLTVNAMKYAIEEIMDIYSCTPKERVGVVFTTAFGPLETNLSFSEMLIANEPDDCSPIVFSNTVHNACLGNIAIDTKITGAGTMLLGSNHFLLCEMLLNQKKADLMFAGSVEEYSRELSCSLKKNGLMSRNIGECCIVLALARDDYFTNKVSLEKNYTLYIGNNPYEVNSIEGVDTDAIKNVVDAVLKDNEVKYIFINDKSTTVGQFECQYISQKYPYVIIVDRLYYYFGNCLGADFSLKILISKLCLEHDIVPRTLFSNDNTKENLLKKIAVLSTDITGNYYGAVCSK